MLTALPVPGPNPNPSPSPVKAIASQQLLDIIPATVQSTRLRQDAKYWVQTGHSYGTTSSLCAVVLHGTIRARIESEALLGHQVPTSGV